METESYYPTLIKEKILEIKDNLVEKMKKELKKLIILCMMRIKNEKRDYKNTKLRRKKGIDIET